MRLINIQTFKLEEHFEPSFEGPNPLRYAILSHRWSNSETTYKDFVKSHNTQTLGYNKIRNLCTFAAEYWPTHCVRCRQQQAPCQLHAVSHVWIDTCCIDKRSSAELSEAINSMWNWYRQALYCVAHLADVHLHAEAPGFLYKFTQSDWFTRGWTLQELLAPQEVVFCSSDWTPLGRRNDEELLAAVAATTGIDSHYLTGITARIWNDACIAQKFSWVAKRKTTRSEDTAYCLLGLLGVNMSLLYGEGGERAFRRLQLQLIAQSEDESIFAWKNLSSTPLPFTPILATHPRYFVTCSNVHPLPWSNRGTIRRKPYLVTQKGIQFKADATKISGAMPIQLDDDRGQLFQLPREKAYANLDEMGRNFYVMPLRCRDVSPIDGTEFVCELILVADDLDVGEKTRDWMIASRVMHQTLQCPYKVLQTAWEDGEASYKKFYLSTAE